MNFYMPARIYTGSGSFYQHRDEVRALGRRCLIVTGASSAKKCGAFDDAAEAFLAVGIEYTVYDKIAQNPALASCMEAGRIANEFKADFVLGIGGGSAMDAAKAAAVFASNPTLSEKDFYDRKWENDPLPIVLIGTTSGTGSEVTNVAVLTDSKQRKHSIHDDRMYSAMSFGDPKYTMTLPASVTLSTGIDVLAHAAESYFSKKSNEISRAFSVRAISLLVPNLRSAAEGRTLTAGQRAELYEASILGGLAICVTGTVFAHNVGYYLTENYHIPHGTASAAFLPELLEHAGKADAAYTGKFYSALGMSESELLSVIELAMPELDVSMTAEEIEAALPRWENNNSVMNTIGTVTADAIRSILIKKFVK